MTDLVQDLMRGPSGAAAGNGDGDPAAVEVPQTYPCPQDGCDFTTESKSGLGIHLSRTHGITGSRSGSSRKRRSRRQTAAPAAPKVETPTFDQTAAVRLVAPDLPRPTLMKLLLDWSAQGEYLADEIAKDRKR